MKIPTPLHAVLTLLLLAWHAAAPAAMSTDKSTCSASSGPSRASLLELYTSEGCSSCPPADRWLSELRARSSQPHSSQPRPQPLVPLAFHVDYWNQLGWPDRFSRPAYSARQRWIAQVNRARTVYTPQFVLDGRDWRPRGGLPPARDQAAAAQLRLELGPASGDRLEVQGEARMHSRMPRAQVYLALYENNLSSRIAAGENAGRLLRHDYVVRELVGPLRLPASGVLAIRHGFDLGADWKRADLGVSAFVQDGDTGEVYQALQRPACGG